jgi:phosphatidylserine synthase
VNEQEKRRRQKRRVYLIAGGSFIWTVFLMVWFFAYGNRFPKFENHSWVVMAALLVAALLFLIPFWRRGPKGKGSRAFIVLKIVSDVLLVALIAGFLWKWSSTLMTVIAVALVLSYLARFARASISLASHDRSQ